MKKRLKLLTTKDATPAPKQIKQPCSDCPWARASLNGWLGGNTAEEWIQFAHGETHIECHVHPNVQCAGAAIYRANVCKNTRSPEILKLKADREKVFVTPAEFIKHHKSTPERRLNRIAAGEVDIQLAFDEVQAAIDKVSEAMTRRQYKELLLEIQTDVECALEAVEEELKKARL